MPTIEWMQFILANRRSYEAVHKYDIVIGPTADDSTNATLNAYMRGLYGDPQTVQAMQMVITLLQPLVLATQVYFRTQKATRILESNPRKEIYL